MPSELLPHRQLLIEVSVAVPPAGLPDGEIGVRVKNLPSMVVSPKPWAVTVTLPVALVATAETNLVGDVASQPQLPAAGKEATPTTL